MSNDNQTIIFDKERVGFEHSSTITYEFNITASEFLKGMKLIVNLDVSAL